jgi:predicted Zn-dependent protease
LLLSGFSELRVVDPKNCLLTGSTRDGLFLIEDGKITQAVRNLLIRETPVYVFKELEEIGTSEVTSTTGRYFPMHLPPLRVKDVLYGAGSGLI